MKGRTGSYISWRGELVEVDLTAEQAALIECGRSFSGRVAEGAVRRYSGAAAHGRIAERVADVEARMANVKARLAEGTTEGGDDVGELHGELAERLDTAEAEGRLDAGEVLDDFEGLLGHGEGDEGALD